MNIGSWLLWGLLATTILSVALGIFQGFGITRMSFPLLLGTMFTPDRDRAKLYGAVTHFITGLLFSLIYVLVFQSVGRATWWIGAVGGVIHGLFLLVVVLPSFPGFHPRMASEHHGPTATRYFEPPGFLGLNYGIRTPIATLVSHVLFGVIMGAFYNMH